MPASHAPGGEALVYIGSYVAEGGDGLAWVNLDGKKRGGRHWIGGNWTGAKLLAHDAGAKRDDSTAVYVASDWEGELRLSAMDRNNNPRDVVKWNYPDKTQMSLSAIAVHDGLMVCALPKTSDLIFVDAVMGVVLKSVPCEPAASVAFDSKGDLYALQGTRVMRCRLPADLMTRLGGARLARDNWSVSAETNPQTAAAAIDGKPDTRWETRESMKPGHFFAIDFGATVELARLELICGGDFPRGYEVFASTDGERWGQPLARGEGRPGRTTIALPPARTRHVRIVQTKSDGPWFSINEIMAFGPARGEISLSWEDVGARGLEEPQQICFDRRGRIYVSDRGASHQIKVFSPSGRYISAVGRPGAPRAGRYDPNHMNNPQGITVDDRDQLWVAEEDYQPKRVSVWGSPGRLVRAFYGPSEYGGGGTLDPRDKTRFYYRGLEFRLDWATGIDTLQTVFFRHEKDALLPADGYGSGGPPEAPHYVDGRRYFSNWNDSNPTNGAGVVAVWADRGGVAHPVAAAGSAKGWSRIHSMIGTAEQFSVRWSGKLVAPATGTWTFSTVSDDGVRLWVGKTLVIDNWTDHGSTENSAAVELSAGVKTDVKLEYYQGGGGAAMRLLWSGPGRTKEVVPASCLVSAGASEPRGLSAEYFRGKDLRQSAMKKVDPVVDFNWPNGTMTLGGGPDAAAMIARLPEGATGRDELFFIWSDLNRDEKLQPAEVQFVKGSVGGITVGEDLTFTAARIDGRCTSFAPVRFERDVPVYDVARATVNATDVYGPASSGGDQALVASNGWTVLSLGVKPLAMHSLSGVYRGEAKWSYPNPWPGLHASHEAPTHSFPGQVIGTTRFLGGLFEPPGSDAGPLWAINGNMGNMYVFTVDGLFVATLFKDVRQGAAWSMPVAERGMRLNDVSPHDENFWPTLTQTSDGGVYVVDGGRTSLVRVENMDSIRLLPKSTIRLSERDLKEAQAYHLRRELARQAALGSGVLGVELRAQAPVVDGALEEWSAAEWATIDKRGTAANFDSNTRPYDVAGAACVHGERLYLAWRTTEGELLRNSGEMPSAPFKTGGCLDVMIGADPGAKDDRSEPVRGDIRLLITRVGGATKALVYRAVVPGTRDPVPFSSPWRTITIDRVDDVSDDVQLAQNGGAYEVSIPLSTIGLVPRAGASIRADIGVLRGDGMQTLQRVYWANKGTAITSDVPSEAMLTPALWGHWRFK